MDATQSAFYAYKNAPSKFIEKSSTPKKAKANSKQSAKTNTANGNGVVVKKRQRVYDETSPVKPSKPANTHSNNTKQNGDHHPIAKKQKPNPKQQQLPVEQRRSVGHEQKGSTKSVVSKRLHKNSKKMSDDDAAVVPLNSIENGIRHLNYILSPVTIDDFMSTFWEKNSMCVARGSPDYYRRLLSIEDIDKMLCNNMIEYTKNIDVTSYVDGVRETHNPEGRALPSSVWDFYREGCSIRLINPQTYLPPISRLNAALQEHFHSMVGANVYLTPPNSQGFAPHYDDIEAFVLQIEGKKTWRLYDSHNRKEKLARVSSGNFGSDENGEPIMEKTLEPGDLLYFPRGTIHEARTVPGSHSLHITVSVYQKTAYADLLEILLPQALQTAIDEDIEFRRGLPLNIWHEYGAIRSSTDARQPIGARVKTLFHRVFNHLDVDKAVDQLALKYQHDALPPQLTAAEKNRTVYGTKTQMNANGEMAEVKLNESTEIRLVRRNIIRLVHHEDTVRIYYYSDNSKEYHEYDMNFVEIENELVPVIEHLVKSYPTYTRLDQLPLSLNDNFTIVYELWGRGVLMTRESLNQTEN